MNHDRIAGAAQTLGGKAMAGVGAMLGDEEVERRGRQHQRVGKVRNFLGSIREMVGLDARPSFATPQCNPNDKDQTMNEDEFKGGVRYVKGKIEKGAGDLATDTKWQADGIVDQVAGGAQNLYGRAKEKVKDVIDDAPGALADAGDKVRDVAQQGRTVASEQVKQNPWALVAAAGVVGYALSWLVHGKRA